MGMTMGLVGAGGALAGLFGGGTASSLTPPPQFIMPNQTQAANSLYSGINNFQSAYGSLGQGTIPYAQNLYGMNQANPYMGMAQSGANTGAGMGMGAAMGAYGAGGQLMGGGQSMLPYASSIMNTAFDPQNALYNRTLQQTQDQTLAGLAGSGLATTPYGQGVLGQTLSNFNIDWQNNLLNRQATGAGAAGGLLSNAGGAINTGAGIMNTAPGQYATAAGMPYSTYSGLYNTQLGNVGNYLNTMSGAANLDNMSNQNYLNYVSAGNAANQTANQNFLAQLQQNQLGFNQNLQLGNLLGGGLATMGKATTSNSPLWANMFG